MLTFGTDGVRGVAFDELSEEYVFNLGRVAAQVLGINTVVVGRDTRESGQRLLTALSHGSGSFTNLTLHTIQRVEYFRILVVY